MEFQFPIFIPTRLGPWISPGRFRRERFIRRAWGHGYATESAKAALEDVLQRAGLEEIVSYTRADNLRSQAVMARLKFQRKPSCDFVAEYEGVGLWYGMVWIAFSAKGRTQI